MWASQVVLVVKNLPVNAGNVRDAGLIPGSGRSLGGGHGNQCQYSCLENPMDRGVWWATVHVVTKSWIQLKWLSMHAHMTRMDLNLCRGQTQELYGWSEQEISTLHLKWCFPRTGNLWFALGSRGRICSKELCRQDLLVAKEKKDERKRKIVKPSCKSVHSQWNEWAENSCLDLEGFFQNQVTELFLGS